MAGVAVRSVPMCTDCGLRLHAALRDKGLIASEGGDEHTLLFTVDPKVLAENVHDLVRVLSQTQTPTPTRQEENPNRRVGFGGNISRN